MFGAEVDIEGKTYIVKYGPVFEAAMQKISDKLMEDYKKPKTMLDIHG